MVVKKAPAIPVNSPTRALLPMPQREGFERRWIVDDPDRIEQTREVGYEPVRDAKGGTMTRRGHVLMEIPKEFYDARQDAKSQAVYASRKTESKRAREEMERRADEGVMRGKVSVIGGVEYERI